MTEVPTITLNDGNKMPLLGLGVFQIPDHEKARQTVEMALANGYRMIDTAEVYENQIAVGEAIAESAVNRDDIFLTTKIWVSNMSFKKATKAIDHDLKELGTDYLDLVLLHQPYGDTFGAWNALAAAKRAGKVRSIGLSNFYPDQYMNLELAHEDLSLIHISEPTRLRRISYAVFCLKKIFLMIRRPPRSTLMRSSAASDVYKRQGYANGDFITLL